MTEFDTGINLTGMMNCGKTTVGNIIAKQHDLTFVDTDDLITEACGQTPGDIIQGEGPERFMEIQREIILGHDRSEVEVWATGGAVAKDPVLAQHIRKFGLNVFMFVDPDILEARTPEADQAKLANPNGLSYRDLYLLERLPLYMATSDIVMEIFNVEETEQTTAHRIVDSAERYVPDRSRLETVRPENLTRIERAFLARSFYDSSRREDQAIAERLGVEPGEAISITLAHIRSRSARHARKA